MSRTVLILRIWLPIAIAVTGLSALVFGTVQQVLRQDANDPQIQMAEYAAAALNGGASTGSLLASTRVDIAHSLAPFLVLYDKNGRPLAGSGLLDGQLPDYPLGALQAALSSGENRVTWQPRSDARIASVVVPYKGGYVVSGRSLREVEQREAQTQTMALIAWAVTLLASLAAAVLSAYMPAG